MASLSSSLLTLLSVFQFISLSQLTHSTSIPIPIPLTHFHSSPPSPLWQQLHNLAAASLTRAHRLKTPKPKSTPLSAHSYGGYSVSLAFGTPPQTLPFIMDTGSDVVWFPCTRNYVCRNCSFASTQHKPIPSFIPKLSSSAKILGCLNPKCGWMHKQSHAPRCKRCVPPPPPGSTNNCTQICPPYILLYASGSTGGVLLSETLHLAPPKTVEGDFIVGCSLFSAAQPAGIAGFGRGLPSLPAQLGLHKFSYCLLSHIFDDSAQTSELLLGGDKVADGVNYTPFVENPAVPGKEVFSAYYYVGLRRITVGGKRVKVPYDYLSIGEGGDGGTIVDSGTTFTFMAEEVFELVAAELEKQVSKYARAKEVETLTGLRPCYNVSGETKAAPSLPEMGFHFKGGAEMKLPLANYFSLVDPGDHHSTALCFTVVTGSNGGGGVSGSGPSIILGNFQMQNFYVEYDLRNEKFGFRQQRCNK